MVFNNEKFELLRYGKDTTITSCTSYSTSTGEIIDEKSDIKDLGVIISNDNNNNNNNTYL